MIFNNSCENTLVGKKDDWNDDNIQLQVYLNLENTSKFPRECPICKQQCGHLYYHLHKQNHAGIWTWCSNCKAYSHYSGYAPIWWKNPPFINPDKLCSVPTYLDENSELIDKWVSDLLNTQEKSR